VASWARPENGVNNAAERARARGSLFMGKRGVR
jgi:hypothetical protein